jgi:hypothetical protein
MLTLAPGTMPIYICIGPTDMRKGFDGLMRLAEQQAARDVLQGGLFIFVNRRRDRVKLLWWDEDGLAIWYKKLESEDTQIFGFTEVEQYAHDRHGGVAEAGRMVGISRKTGPRRCVMPRQGSLSVPPRAAGQREPFPSTNFGHS